jgi:hypothetical protein
MLVQIPISHVSAPIKHARELCIIALIEEEISTHPPTHKHTSNMCMQIPISQVRLMSKILQVRLYMCMHDVNSVDSGIMWHLAVYQELTHFHQNNLITSLMVQSIKDEPVDKPPAMHICQ